MLRFVHLNIEGSKHLERVYTFLKAQNPDVVCMQELPEVEVSGIESFLGMKSLFVSMAQTNDELQGIGIFSRHPIIQRIEKWYGGSKESLPTYDETDYESRYSTSRFILAVCGIETEGEVFRIGTTHFPVTEKGSVTEYQHTSVKRLLALLEKQGELVFSGDFNAPRGGEIFSMIAEKYKDNVPLHYIKSLDYSLHRAGKNLEADATSIGLTGHMVDGLFSTSGYEVSDVEMVCGVSDHCALVANISKKEEVI